MSAAVKYFSFMIIVLFLFNTIPSVQSQGDIYPWDIEIDFENDDSSEPFDISEDGKASVTFIVSNNCLLYTSPSPRDLSTSRMPSSA